MKRFLLLFCALLCLAPAHSSIKESIDRGSNKNVVEAGTYNGHSIYVIASGTYVYTYGRSSRSIYINNQKYKYTSYSSSEIKCSALVDGFNLIEEKNGEELLSTEYLVYKGIRKDTTCLTNKDHAIVISNTDVARWEVSHNGGVTWENDDTNQTILYIANETEEGTVLYRNVSAAGEYSDIITVQYIDAVPAEVKASVDNNVKTVDEAVTFTLDVPDRGYAYQWFKDGVAIDGATQNTYTIDAIKTKDAGSYTCRVSNVCSESTSVPATLSVNRCPQAIQFPELQTETYGCAPIDLPPTTNKGLSVTYQSSNTAVATISGHTLTVVGPGEANIIASQAGDDDYLAAATVTRTLRVNKIAQTISFSALPHKTYGDLPFTLPEKSSEGLTLAYRVINTEVATVNGNVVTIVGAGTTEIIASQDGDALHYAAAPVTQTLTVDKAAQTITFLPLTPCHYGDPDITLNAVTDKGLPITYTAADPDIARIEGNTIHIGKVGSTTLTATQPGNRNYLAATTVTQTLTVKKAPQTIVFSNLPNCTYGAPDLELPKTTDKGLSVAYATSDSAVAIPNGNMLRIVGVGTCQITASQAGDDRYNAAESRTVTLIVSKAYSTITFAALPACTYGDGRIELKAKSTSGTAIRFVSSDETVARIEGNYAYITGAGTCTITAYAQTGANWYDATPVTHELTVSKATQTVSFLPLEDRTYGDSPVRLNATASSGLDVTFRSSDSNVALIDGTELHITGAGDATITATQPGDRNYLPTSATATLHVNKATLTITPQDVARIYGDANPDIALSYEGFVSADTEYDLDVLPTPVTDATTKSPVGGYDISVKFGADRNYTIDARRGTLTVAPAPLLIRANDAEKTYGDANPTFRASYEGLKLNETAGQALSIMPSFVTPARTSSPAGTYPVEATGAEAANYAVTYAPGVLTVEKATLRVTLPSVTTEYGDEPEWELSYTGWKLNDNEEDLDFPPRIVTEATTASYPGQYAARLEGGLDDNYTFSLPSAESRLTVTRAPLDVYAPDTAKAYGTPNPDFVLRYVGFKNGETEDDLERRPTATCNATTGSWYGEYTIFLSGGYDSRYSLNLHNGRLTVTRPTGLTTAQADDTAVKLSSRGGVLIVQTPHELERLEVFDAAGRRIAIRSHVAAGETRIDVGTSGPCLVRIMYSGKVRVLKIYIN